ncbi:MAG: PepSY domain-containing protein [Eikenella sp.]|nr:PepSY domain-containing protein [Eikenella sp.]
MLHTRKHIAWTLAAGLMAASLPALADNDEMHYHQNRSQYISYEQAAKIAADKVGGHVSDVDFEYSPIRGAYFEVEVYGRDGEYDVIIDAKTGRVISSYRDY